jgi:ABC-type nitrate/sulfonate/bicarbonate transport system substrate-binding protein
MNRKNLLLAVTLTLAFAGCGGPGQTPEPTQPAGGQRDKVRLALDWTPNTNHTGIYVAQARGWYAENGIDLEILPYSPANTPDTLVGTGQAEVGISFTEAVVTDRVNKLPVKSIAAILQSNTSALATLKGSGLDTPAKLEGKRYAGFGSPYEEPVIKTVLRNAGAPNGDFRIITTNVFGYQALVAGQADFMWMFAGWDGVQAQLAGVELNLFMLTDHGVPDYYTPVIIANEAFLTEKPEEARRFLAATARGYESAVSSPEEAASVLVQQAPAGTFESSELPIASQKYLAKYLFAEGGRWGMQTLKRWTDYPRFIAETGLLKDANGKVVKPEDLDYQAMFTNDYLPQP